MTAKRFDGRETSFMGCDVREVSVSINDSILVMLKSGECIEAEYLTA